MQRKSFCFTIQISANSVNIKISRAPNIFPNLFWLKKRKKKQFNISMSMLWLVVSNMSRSLTNIIKTSNILTIRIKTIKLLKLTLKDVVLFSCAKIHLLIVF